MENITIEELEKDLIDFDPSKIKEIPIDAKCKEKFFIDYDGKSMKLILTEHNLSDYWGYSNIDSHEVVEAPDSNWLFNIIYELYEIQGLDKKTIINLLEEYFVERNKTIINEWRQISARYLDLYPEEYDELINK